MEDLYREMIIERFKFPLFKGVVDEFDIEYEDDNPLCGDNIRLTISLDEQNRIADAKHDGVGCAISLASADLLIEHIHGKTLEELKELDKQTVLDLLGIELGPVRLKCALLSLKVVKSAAYGIPVEFEE